MDWVASSSNHFPSRSLGSGEEAALPSSSVSVSSGPSSRSDTAIDLGSDRQSTEIEKDIKRMHPKNLPSSYKKHSSLLKHITSNKDLLSAAEFLKI